MGKVAGAQRFDGQNWYKQHIAKRTREALDEQDQALRRTLGKVSSSL